MEDSKAHDRDWKYFMAFANDDHPGKDHLVLVPRQLTSRGHLDDSKILMPQNILTTTLARHKKWISLSNKDYFMEVRNREIVFEVAKLCSKLRKYVGSCKNK